MCFMGQDGVKPGRSNAQHSDGAGSREGSPGHLGSAVATGWAAVATLGAGPAWLGAASPEGNGLLSKGEADTALH